MLVRSFRGAGVAVFLASLMWAQAGPDGHWEGTLKVDNREVGLSLDLAKNEKAEWTASMGVPSENATGLFVKDVAVSGQSVKFMAVMLQMATADLTLSPDGKLAATADRAHLVHLWKIPDAVTGDAPAIVHWAELMADEKR